MKIRFPFLALLAFALLVAARPAVLFNDLVGSWSYTIADVPPEYQEGVFQFEEKDNATVGFMGANKEVPLKELSAAEGKVSFKFDFDGGVIAVNMVQSGDTLRGNLSSQYGEFPIVAVKKK
jgi:hypothetical protein